ncbi:MAG: SurA N-terminal domain-containing protein [bacterium]
MRKVFLFFLCVTLNLCCDDRIIAKVEDEIITQKELSYEKKDIEAIIDNILLQKKAAKLGIVVSESMVLERIEEIKNSFSSPSLFKEALQAQGIDEPCLKLRIKNEITKARLINLFKERIRIAEDELLLNFDKYQSEVCVDFLERENEEDAKKAFLELTKFGTTNLEIKNTGFFCYPEMQEEFSKQAFGLDEGKISHPFKIGKKFYIIKGAEKRETEDLHLAKIRDELFMEVKGRIRQKTKDETRDDIQYEILGLIEEKLKEKRLEEYLSSFIQELRKNAYVKK